MYTLSVINIYMDKLMIGKEVRAMEPYEQGPRRRESGANHAQSRRSGKLGQREKRRLLQLFSCILLFVVVFSGKMLLPWDESALGKTISGALGQNIDFKAVFSALGESLSDGRPVTEALNQIYLAVFHPEQIKPEPVVLSGLAKSEALFLSGNDKGLLENIKDIETIAQHRVALAWKKGPSDQGGSPVPNTTAPTPTATPTPTPTPAPTPTPTPAPTPTKNTSPKGIAEVSNSGETLPEKTSMEKVALAFAYMTPVSGKASSEFGYREHPIDGGNKFHYGLDIAAETGTKIKAFADGTVDYVGESEAYGNYTRLKHADGVTSFYAHCSKLLVQKGQKVKKGDVIALVGATGHVTGPHLHLEIKKDGVFLNPHYYVDIT